MMKLGGKSGKLVGIFGICAVLTLFGWFYLDTRIAGFIAYELGRSVLHSEALANMPDYLFQFVCAVTLLSWTARLCLIRKPAWRRYAELMEYVGTGLPLAFIMKAGLKDVFGRVNTRAWLLHPHVLKFHWFDGGGKFSGFPSGHMAIFTVLALGFSREFPRLRLPCAGLLLALALALLLTQYHFLSDIAAGVAVGVIVDLFVCRTLPLFRRLLGRQRCSVDM